MIECLYVSTGCLGTAALVGVCVWFRFYPYSVLVVCKKSNMYLCVTSEVCLVNRHQHKPPIIVCVQWSKIANVLSLHLFVFVLQAVDWSTSTNSQRYRWQSPSLVVGRPAHTPPRRTRGPGRPGREWTRRFPSPDRTASSLPSATTL